MLLASCGTEIKFHRWPSGDYYGSYQIPEAGFYIPSISWCIEGEFLATTVPSLGPPVVIAVGESDIQTYQVVDIAYVQSTAFSRTTQENIAFGTEYGQVLIYDIHQKSLAQQLPLLPSGVKHLQFGAQDTSLAAGCKNGQICLFNTKYDVCATFYIPNSGTLSAMCCHSRLPHVLAATSPEGVVVVWDSSTGDVKLLDKPHTASITDVAFSSNEVMATVGLDEKFIGYDLRTKECTFCCRADGQLSAVAFMPGSDQIAVATIDGKLFCYDRRAISHPIHTIVAHHPKAIGRIAFQNLPGYEDAPPSDIFETQASKSKSNVTTVVYNTSQNQSFARKQESAETLSQEASTVNSITPDSDLECVGSNAGEFVTYLQSLPHSYMMHNRGDAASQIVVGLDCKNLNRPLINPLDPPQPIARGDEVLITKLPGSVNIQYNFVSPSKYAAEEAFDTKSESISNWIKKLPLSSSVGAINQVTGEEDGVLKLRRELQEATKQTIEQLVEMINKEFLKIRMAVSRGFVQMEYKMNTRWDEFNLALAKTAGYASSDDASEIPKEVEERSNVHPTSTRIPTRTSQLSKMTER